MMKTQENNYKEITTFDEHLESRYGPLGTRKRTEFEIKAKAFAIGEIIGSTTILVESRKLAEK